MNSSDPQQKRFRAHVLLQHGATESLLDELLDYTENDFAFNASADQVTLPMEDEPFADAWRSYLQESKSEGVVSVLKRRVFTQLNFPIGQSVCQQDDYRAVVRRGEHDRIESLGDAHLIEDPSSFELTMQPTPAGHIAVVVIGNRRDFENVLRAVTMNNQPREILPSVGAQMVAGFNNWDRIHDYRRRWESRTENSTADWAAEFRRLRLRKELYQDRFILLSRGPYSGVRASDLGLDEDQWLTMSHQIRLHHECTHYFTRRMFGSMRNSLFDELIADYIGICEACGQFQPDWFLRFMGLEAYPELRSGSRIEQYCGTPPLSPKSFAVIQSLLIAASRNLKLVDYPRGGSEKAAVNVSSLIRELCRLTLEEIASVDFDDLHRSFT